MKHRDIEQAGAAAGRRDERALARPALVLTFLDLAERYGEAGRQSGEDRDAHRDSLVNAGFGM